MNLLSQLSVASAAWAGGAVAILVDASVKGTAVLLIAAAVVRALRGGSAAARHMVWSLSCLALLLLPVLALVGPRWTVPGLERFATPGGASVVASSGDVGPTPVASTTAAIAGPATPVARAPSPTAAAVAQTVHPSLPVTPSAGARASRAPLVTDAVPEPAGHGAWHWGTWLLALWFLGVALVAAWIVGGLVHMRLMARSGRVVSKGPLAALVEEIAQELDIRRPVTLVLSTEHAMPMTWGIRPTLLLPEAAQEWTDAKLRSVVLHELAHVQRGDFQTQLMARVGAALYWFNPLVWLAVGRMRVERELACDDAVLRSGSRASDYAAHVLEIAHAARPWRFAPAGAVPLARQSQLGGRLQAVLDAERRRTAVTPQMAVLAWATAACIVLPLSGAELAGDDSESSVADAAPAPAAVATSSLVERTAALLSGLESGVAAPSSPVDRVAETAATAPAPSIAGAAMQGCDWTRRGGSSSSSIQMDDDDVQIRIRVGDCRLDIDASGEIEFDEAESAVIAISPGGYFEIEEREGRNTRRLEIRPQRGGGLERRWFVDGREATADGEADAFLASMLPVLFRRAGYQAEARATRILERDGVDGLLQEISLLTGSYTTRIYYGVLLSQASLSPAQVERVVRQAGAAIDSDYELAELLIQIAGSDAVDDAVISAYVVAAATLDSDYERRRALSAMLQRHPLSEDAAEQMLQLATDIDSDYELAELLIELLEQHPADEALTPAYFRAVNTLQSDYEHRRVLHAVIGHGGSNRQALDLALESARGITSDYELAELLLEVAEFYPVDQRIPSSYLVAAESIASDYELGRVLRTLVQRGPVSDDALQSVLRASSDLESDHELGQLLSAVIEFQPLSGASLDPFFDAVRGIDSDYEHGQVLKHVLDVEPLTEAIVQEVLRSVVQISSDYEAASVLTATAERFQINDRLRPLFMDAVNTISSTYERDRALAAMARSQM